MADNEQTKYPISEDLAKRFDELYARELGLSEAMSALAKVGENIATARVALWKAAFAECGIEYTPGWVYDTEKREIWRR